jgi:hypothetical protein
MARRGRPRSATPHVVINTKLRLDPNRDQDLIQYLLSAPARLRAPYILLALRLGVAALAPGRHETQDYTDDLDLDSFLQ